MTWEKEREEREERVGEGIEVVVEYKQDKVRRLQFISSRHVTKEGEVNSD
jgi:hemerythrin superfamily protein